MGLIAAPASSEASKQLGAGQGDADEIAEAEEIHDENPTT
jgi:hypothetical protein